MTTSYKEWEDHFLSAVRPIISWLPTPIFIPRADGVNAANVVGRTPMLVVPPLVTYPVNITTPLSSIILAFPPESPVDDDFDAHESGHAAHEFAAWMRDAWEKRGTAGTDIYKEVAAILSPGVVWPSSGPDLRDEWTAEAFRKTLTKNILQLRYPNPPGQISPYPFVALTAYFQTMNIPRGGVKGDPTMDVIILPSPNFSIRSRPIKYKVIHTTEGYDSRNRLTDAASPDRVSAHYLVRPEGVYQLVPERYAAWHAGRIIGVPTTPLYTGINPNEESIGIEIEGFAMNSIDNVLFQKVVDLIKDIDARIGITPNIGHYELSPGDRTDPGRTNLANINAAVAAEENNDMTPEEHAWLKKVYEQLNAEGPRIWTQRLQDWLSKLLKSLFPGKGDYSGPDVTSGNPRT